MASAPALHGRNAADNELPMPDKPRFAYIANPMDFGWSGFPSVTEYLKKLLDERDGSGGVNAVRSFLAFYDEALELGLSIGWDADFGSSHDARVVLLPDAYLPRLALVWQPESNGTTFVVSEVPMPWLGGQSGQQAAGDPAAC